MDRKDYTKKVLLENQEFGFKVGSKNAFKGGFQIDADQMALSANQIATEKESAKHRVMSKYHFEIPS